MGILNTGGTKALTVTIGKTSIIYTTGTPTYITITFNSLGGTPASYTKQVLANIGQVIPPSPDPTKAGFALIGWSETSGGTTPAAFPVILSAAKTYYAIWEALETVTATFAGLTGATPSSYTAQSGYSPFGVTSPGEPTKVGYSFAGWSPSLPRTITADQTFTAQWSVKQTVITFNPATGNNATNAYATYGLAMPTVGWYIDEFGDPMLVDPMTAPNKEYNNFGGYYDGPNGTGSQYYTTLMGSYKNWDKENPEVMLYARWIPITATATFNSNGGSPTYTSVTNAIPWTVNSPGTPVRDDHTFNGWSPPLPQTITVDTTFNAQWTYIPPEYTVRFFDWDGTPYPDYTQQVSHGGNAITPSDPSRIGHTFTGWSPSPTNVTSARDCVAQYTINTYTVSFEENGGSTVSDQTVNHGSTASSPTTTRDGYIFNGWYSDSGLTTAFDFSTAITSHITLYAGWTQTFTVIFKDWDGTTLKTETVAQGDDATPPADPTRSGYTFTGWTSYTNIQSNTDVVAQYTSNYATSWQETTNTAYNSSMNVVSSTISCPTQANAEAELPDATGYLKGHIIRVRTFTNEPVLCDTYYYEAV